MPTPKSEFEKASEEKQGNIFSEFLGFLKLNRKFWLLPLIIVMLLLAGMLILSSTAAAPFIYSLF